MGFMGGGKSTVGPLLARALTWRFVDADHAVEDVAGQDIPGIFRERGESGFRELEHRVMSGLLRETDLVLASGGGWPCREGRMESLSDDTLSIWLRVSAEQALARVQAGRIRRPLLEVDDPLDRIHELLVQREPYYRKASWTVDTDVHPPRDVVRRVTERLRTDAERPLHI